MTPELTATQIVVARALPGIGYLTRSQILAQILGRRGRSKRYEAALQSLVDAGVANRIRRGAHDYVYQLADPHASARAIHTPAYGGAAKSAGSPSPLAPDTRHLAPRTGGAR